MDAGDAVELFLQSRVARGAADSTLRTYRKALSLFARSYPLTRDGVLAFVAELRSRQLSQLDLRPPRADRTPKAIRTQLTSCATQFRIQIGRPSYLKTGLAQRMGEARLHFPLITTAYDHSLIFSDFSDNSGFFSTA